MIVIFSILDLITSMTFFEGKTVYTGIEINAYFYFVTVSKKFLSEASDVVFR